MGLHCPGREAYLGLAILTVSGRADCATERECGVVGGMVAGRRSSAASVDATAIASRGECTR